MNQLFNGNYYYLAPIAAYFVMDLRRECGLHFASRKWYYLILFFLPVHHSYLYCLSYEHLLQRK